jgi:hypothetical protein
MEVVYPRCCGLDVHQKNVTACLLTVAPTGERQKELRTFGTMTDDLLALADWLVVAGCTHVAMESTNAAARTKDTYLSAQYHRLAARRGKKRAAVGVAHMMLTIIYHILHTGRSYEELGGNFFDERDRKHIARRQIARLEQLGYHVTLERVPA